MYKSKSMLAIGATLVMLGVGSFPSQSIAGSAVVAATTPAITSNHNYRKGVYYCNYSTRVGYYNKLADKRIMEDDQGFYAVHKWLGRVNIESRSGERVILKDGRWFYLKSFKELVS